MNKPPNAPKIPIWEVRAVTFMRILSVLTGVYQIFMGEVAIGLYIFLAVLAITVPGFVTRDTVRYIPHEFEFLFLLTVVLQLIVGETLDFYYVVPYYDKFVHFTLPLLLGLTSFLLAYTMYKTGNLKMSPAPLVALIVMMTLGIGAIWEILEYLYDVIVLPHYEGFGRMQGSMVEDALTDTMNDLIADALGGLIGAIIGLRYIESELGKHRSRLSRIVYEIVRNFRKNPNVQKQA